MHRALKYVEEKDKKSDVKEKWQNKARKEFEKDVAKKEEHIQDIINYRGY